MVELVPNVPATLLLGFAVPMLAGFVLDAYARFAGRPLAVPAWSGPAWMAGTLAMTFPSLHEALLLVGAVAWLASMLPVAIQAMKHAPKETLVSDDPLTKGDDACFKHLVFAHRFLAIGLLLLVAGAASWFWPVAAHRLGVSAMHVLVIGYGLLASYGLAHLWVPRFSGIPAIAAGAIKGELHSTLLGLTGLVLGFLTGITGIMAGLGFFVFVGFFTFMGVIGANMMKNKSKTHQVTPEFVYIPFTFTAVFWLISAVLMGLFLNVVPDLFADRYGDLVHLHLVAGILGGFVQLGIGLLTRGLPMAADVAPPRFQGNLRGAFFAFNGGLVLWLAAGFSNSPWATAGLGLVAIGLMLLAPLAKLIPSNAVAPA